MFERLKNIINAMFNKGMSQMETPEVLAEQAQSELEGSFKKLREALTSSLANEKMMEKQIQKATEELATWEKRATVAVTNGNDEVAKECLVRKQEQNQNIQSLQSQLAAQKQNSASLKERYQEVEAKLKSFMARKNDMISRHKASDAATKADSLIASSGGGSGLDKWEQKISEKEARAEAIREISGGANSSTEDKFKKLDKHIEMEDELAALKARMAEAGKTPKLIVDANKTQVDDNVPMIVEVIEPGDKPS